MLLCPHINQWPVGLEQRPRSWVLPKALTHILCAALLLLGLSAHADAAGLEKTMRDVQIRRIAVGMTPATWPTGTIGTPPAYPPDGFYDMGNATERASAANALANAFWTVPSGNKLYQYYSDDTDFVDGFTGNAAITQFVAGDFAYAQPAALTSGSTLTQVQAVIDGIAINTARLKWQRLGSGSPPLVESNSPWLQYRKSSRNCTVCKANDASMCDIACDTWNPGYEACRDTLVAMAESLVLTKFSSTPTTTTGWIATSASSAARAKGALAGSVWCLLVCNCCCPDEDGNSLCLPTSGIKGAIILEGIEYKANLVNFPGTLYVYAAATGSGSSLPVTADGNYHLWQTLDGGSMHQWSVMPSLGDNWEMTGILAYYQIDPTRVPDGLNQTPAVTVASPIGPLSGNRTDGNFELARDCTPARGGANPVSANPVALSTGHKVESMTDLVVPVTAGEFTVTREYTSQSDVANSSSMSGVLVGRGWSLSAFRAIVVSGSGSSRVVRTLGPPVDKYLQFDPVSGSPGVWSAGGPTTQSLTEAVVTIDGVSWPVWRLTEPGQWTMEYVREPGVGEPAVDSRLVGLLLRESDPYGNFRFYTYHTSTSQARLYAIYINGLPSSVICDAQIVFDWVLDALDPANGLLRSISVLRPRTIDINYSYDVGRILTQKVEYTYASSPPDNPLSPGTPIVLHEDVGTELDLVQVTKRTLVQDAPVGAVPFWAQITQYRYHTNGLTASGAFDAVGDDHQLKAVIMPEQIEYHAQRWNENSGQVPSTQGLEAAAALLLAAADDDNVGWATASTLTVRDLYAKIVSYATSGPQAGCVETQYLQTACGCSGSSSGIRQTYEYYSYDITGPGSADGLTTRIIEDSITDASTSPITTELFRTTHHDMRRYSGSTVPYEIRKVVEEPSAAGGRQWVWEYSHTGGNVTQESTPSAFDSYSPYTGSTPPSTVATAATSGLVYQYGYTTDNRLTTVAVRNTSGTFDLVTETLYGLSGHPYAPTEVRKYRVAGSTAADNTEVVKFEYGFYGSPAVAGKYLWIGTRVEAEKTTENGPNDATSFITFELFGSTGLKMFDVDAASNIALYNYGKSLYGGTLSGDTSGVMRTARRAVGYTATNVAGALGVSTSALPAERTSWTSTGSIDLQTEVVWVDPEGRPMVVKGDTGLTNSVGSQFSTLEVAEDTFRPGILYLHKRSMYGAKVPSGVTYVSETASPIQAVWLNASGEVTRTSTFAALVGSGIATTKIEPLLPAANGAELSRTIIEHHLSGLVKSTKSWASIAEDIAGTTSYTYDNLGRVSRTTDAAGNVSEVTSRDIWGRALATSAGTTSSTSLTPTDEFYYDTEDGAFATAPSQGMGNGNLSWIVQHTGETADRVVRRQYDHRDRLVAVVASDAPFEVLSYDHLSRVIERGVFAPAWTGSLPDIPSSPTDLSAGQRGGYALTRYSQRGLVYRTEVAVDPTSSTPQMLKSDRWFDRNGLEVASAAPDAPIVKVKYDTLLRPTIRYVTATRPAASFAIATGANAVTSDKVIEQTEYTYNSGGVKSRFWRTTHRMRLHNASDTDLGDLASKTHVATYQMQVFDDFNRPIADIDYGTNLGTSTLDSGGTAPSYTTTLPTTVPHTKYSYDERGLVNSTQVFQGASASPQYRETRTYFDDLQRSVLTIEGYDESQLTTPAITWSTPIDGYRRPTIPYASSASPEYNRATAVAYDNAGRVSHLVAYNRRLDAYGTPETQEQITANVYGVTAGSSAVATNSLVDSNALLAMVHFPSPSTGLPSTLAQDTVSYAYNLMGEVRATTDRNGTVHATERDLAGRPLSDAVVSFGSVAIDTRVQSRATAYDALGRVHTVKSLGVSSVLDALEYTYDGLGRLTQLKEDVDSDIETSGVLGQFATRSVGYTYTTNTTNNSSRLTSMTYPSGSQLDYAFGSSGTIDDTISRMRTARWSNRVSGNDIEYTYLGLSAFATVRYPVPNVLLDRTFGTDGLRANPPSGTAQVAGRYPGFDKFGRPRLTAWIDNAMTSKVVSSANYPAIPPLVADLTSFDIASKITAITDSRPGVTVGWRDYKFSYDRLDRLASVQRGTTAAGTGTFTASSRSQKWDLDALGNWRAIDKNITGTLNGSGDPVFGTGEYRRETPTNARNQIESLKVTLPTAWSSPVSTTFDDNGSMTELPLSDTSKYLLKYDAWNRLVKVQLDSVPGSGSPTTVAEYEYNAIGWRTRKVVSTPSSQSRVFYYGANWQLLEEHIDDGYSSGTGHVTDRVAQQLWGIRGLNDAVSRRIDNNNDLDGPADWEGEWFYLTDARQNVTALVAPNGQIGERVSYDAYGQAMHRRPSDLRGDGVYDATYVSSRLSGAGCATISAAGYDADLDFNRDGTACGTSGNPDLTLTNDWLTAGTATAVPAGQISETLDAAVAPCAQIAPDNPLGYAGHYFDAETSLYQMRHRVYSTDLGRFLQVDPIGYSDGMSMYQYVGSQPIAAWDPMGLKESWWDSWVNNKYRQRAAGAVVGFVAKGGSIALDGLQLVGATALKGYAGYGEFGAPGSEWANQRAEQIFGEKFDPILPAVHEFAEASFEDKAYTISSLPARAIDHYINVWDEYQRLMARGCNYDASKLIGESGFDAYTFVRAASGMVTRSRTVQAVAGSGTAGAMAKNAAQRLAPAATAPRIVYRGLSAADAEAISAGRGLAAKAPKGTWTAAEHVANSGPGSGGAAANSPWISTSRRLDVARAYDSGHGVVAIDLNKVTSIQAEVWKTAPRVNGVRGLPYHRSLWADEVTIYQHIPQEAIIGSVK